MKKHGAQAVCFILGLTLSPPLVAQNQFRDAVPREDLPLRIILLLDTSDSMKDKLARAQDAAIGFVGTLKEGDLAEVAVFGSKVHIAQAFTSDQKKLSRAIRRTQAGGRTGLYNALYIALKDLSQPRKDIRRQAIVVLSDGEDTSSKVAPEQVMDLAKDTDVTIFAISLRRTDGKRDQRPSEAEHLLKKLAEETGGQSFSPHELKELKSVFNRIAKELKRMEDSESPEKTGPSAPRSSPPSEGGPFEDIRRFMQEFHGPEGGSVTGKDNTLYYDDKGANFVPWLRRMLTEVRRHWIAGMPSVVAWRHGHVAAAVSVVRNGDIDGLEVMVPSGLAGFDTAAVDALRAADLMHLPADYPDSSFEFILVFWYNERPYDLLEGTGKSFSGSAKKSAEPPSPAPSEPSVSKVQDAEPLGGKVVLLKDGSRRDVRRYEVKGQLVFITTPDGKRRSLPLSHVDLEATEKANRNVSTATPDAGMESNQTLSEVQETSADSGAASIGFAGGGSFSKQDFEYKHYVKELFAQINEHWKRVPVRGTASVVIQFTILKDGTIQDVQVEQSSGVALLDRRAARAVLLANPLPPLPESYPDNSVAVHLRFEYSD